MSYVIKPPGGMFGRYEIGYYTPDGEWFCHSTSRSHEAAEQEASILNGGDGGAAADLAREYAAAEKARLDDAREARRAQEKTARELERTRAATAAQEATNLAERARMHQETVAENQRMQAQWQRTQEDERAKWLAAEEENRRKAQAEAAEQLRRYPPLENRTVGGVSDWNGEVVYHLQTGETVTVLTRP